MPLNIEMRIAFYKDDQSSAATVVSSSRTLPHIDDNQEVSDEFSLIAQEVFMKFKRFIKAPGDIEVAVLKSKGHSVDIFMLRHLLSGMEEGKLMGDVTAILHDPDHRTVVFDLRRPPST